MQDAASIEATEYDIYRASARASAARRAISL